MLNFQLCIPVWGAVYLYSKSWTSLPQSLIWLSPDPPDHLSTCIILFCQCKLPFSTFDSLCFFKQVSRPSKWLHQQHFHSHSFMDALHNLSAWSICNMLLFLPHPFIISYPTYSVQVFTVVRSVFGSCPNLFHPATLFIVALPITFNDSQICHFLPNYSFSQSASPSAGSTYQSTPISPQEFALFSAFSSDSFPSVTYQKRRTLRM